MEKNFTLYDASLAVHGELININQSQKINIKSISIVSGEISPGALFIAIKGRLKDGHAFINESFDKGAVAALVEDRKSLGDKPGILVNDSRLAAAKLSEAFLDYPLKQLVTIGVTGTNGKTTTNWIIYHMLHGIYGSALRIGTLGTEFLLNSQVIRAEEGNLTSPDAITTANIFSDALACGIKSAVMEVSSIGLDQLRSDGISFDGVVFTNLTRDHLDYHHTMQNYFKAKLKLFDLLAKSEKKIRIAVINIDDPYGKEVVKYLKQSNNIKIVTYGRDNIADIRITEVSQSSAGSYAKLEINGKKIEFSIPLIGRHNIENASAALGLFLGLGHKLEQLLEIFTNLPQVPGRLESVGFNGVGIYVDYAHTPDAIENVLSALRPITNGRLWVLFGCGGDRDRGKRPQMAVVAAKLADMVVVTSDNPRTENPDQIISDVLMSGIKPELVEVDRRKAIAETVKRAMPGDIVLIAGKGHENYQIIGTTKHHFSDVEEVLSLRDIRNIS